MKINLAPQPRASTSLDVDMEEYLQGDGAEAEKHKLTLAPSTERRREIGQEQFRKWTDKWLAAKHKIFPRSSAEMGLPLDTDALIQSHFVLPREYWSALGEACCRPREVYDTADVSRTQGLQSKPYALITVVDHYADIVTAHNSLRPNDLAPKQNTKYGHDRINSPEIIDKYKLKRRKAFENNFATIENLFHLNATVMGTLRPPKEGGGGLLRSGRERLQICAIVSMVFFGNARVSDIILARGYHEAIYGLLWGDVRFFYHKVDDEILRCVEITLRNCKMYKHKLNHGRRFIVYSDPSLPPCADLYYLLATLAIEDRALEGVDGPEFLDASLYADVLQPITNSVSLPLAEGAETMPVFRRVAKKAGSLEYETTDQPWEVDDFYQQYARVSKVAGTDVTPYTFRRGATTLIATRSDIRDADAKLGMGHSITSHTRDLHYIPLTAPYDLQGLLSTGKEKRAAVAALGAALKSLALLNPPERAKVRQDPEYVAALALKVS